MVRERWAWLKRVCQRKKEGEREGRQEGWERNKGKKMTIQRYTCGDLQSGGVKEIGWI